MIMSSDTYVPKIGNRKSIKIVIDGFEMIIDKHNAGCTVEELFEDVVFNRQVKSVVRYLSGKYGVAGLLSLAEAEHELQGLSLPSTDKDVFSYETIAKIIANDVVTAK